MTSPDMHTLAGAYALNALSEHERARFERHLIECAACTAEVRELQATAARLGEAAAESPPPELKQRVLAEVATTRQDRPKARGSESLRTRASRGVPRWAMGIAVAAAVVALALAGVLGGIAVQKDGELNTATEQIQRLQARYGPMSELLRAPDARISHASSGIGGTATVLYSPSQHKAIFLAEGLPQQPKDRDYQLWVLTPDHVEPAPVLPEKGRTTAMLLEDVRDSAKLALTIEPEGGSEKPSMKPFLTVKAVM